MPTLVLKENNLLIHNHQSAIGWNSDSYLLLALDGGNAAVELGIIAIDKEFCAFAEEAEVDLRLQRLLVGIDTHDEPVVASTTGDDGVLARIAVDELHLIPSSGHVLHEVNGPCRCIGEVVGRKSEVLNSALEEHSSSESINVGSDTMCAALVAGVIVLVEGRTTEVHRTDGVADEGMQRSVHSLSVARALSEVEVLRSEHSLAGSK